MSLEAGGRADKYGNIYENRFLARLYIRLIREEISSITVEPLGPNSDYVEYIAEYPDGTSNYYQCKAANGVNTAWSFSDLKKYDVFNRAKKIVESSNSNKYYFISPLLYKELDELCKRSRTNNSGKEFASYQLSNSALRNYYSDIAKEYGLNKDEPEDQEKIRRILSRCYFEQVPDGTNSKTELETYVSLIFTGKPSTVRVLLENYAGDTDRFGQKTTTAELIEFLKNNGVYLRNSQISDTVYPIISALNDRYCSSYPAIYGNLVHRSATEKLIDSIQKGKSVILHGKAGSGKSGCLQELKNYLEMNKILYLSIKLDKKVPSGTDDEYGKSLGLPESPVSCLAKLAAGKKCVLILDQLDALRWTNAHSGDALDVCKDLIKRCDAINKRENGHISIIFASRTFDLENDAGLRDLFSIDNGKESNWDKIGISYFTEEELVSIIGDRYNALSPRLQNLLLTPSSLYVWSKLSDAKQAKNITSVNSLMSEWWKEIIRQCNTRGITDSDVKNCKNKIVQYMERRSAFSLPSVLFGEYENVVNALISVGLLNDKNLTSSISFTHQSFLDYFITVEIIDRIYQGKHLDELMHPYDEQTPMLRYRLLAILQNLIDTDPYIFAEEALRCLKSDKIRYYFKCAIFEIIGQCEQPDESVLNIIESYYKLPEWEKYIRQVVLFGHPQYVMKSAIFLGNNWFNEKDLYLLRSICDSEPDFVAELLEPYYSENNLEQNRKIWDAIYHDINLDSDRLYSLRKRLIEKEPSLIEHSACILDLISSNDARAIELMDILLKKWPGFKGNGIYWGNKSLVISFARFYRSEIIKVLFPTICMVTKDYCCCWPDHKFHFEFNDWIEREYNETAVRQIADIVRESIKSIAENEPEQFAIWVNQIEFPISSIAYGMIIFGIRHLPIQYGDFVIKWVVNDFNHRIFSFTSNPQDYLEDAKALIKKYTPDCSEDIYAELENVICTWSESPADMIDTFKHRCEVNHMHKYPPVYYTYWGHMQKALLPYMDRTRLSPYAAALLQTVNRNDQITFPHFYCGMSVTSGGAVHSPIDRRLNKISDNTWLQIVSTPENEMRNQFGRWNDNEVIEATPEAFASSFGTAVKMDPKRMANLALKFPDNCYGGYISNLFYGLRDIRPNMDSSIIFNLVRKFLCRTDNQVVISIIRYIEKYSAYQWPDEILQYISELALHHCDPEANEYPLTDHDCSYCSIENVLGDSYNSTRGCAAYTIAALILDHEDLLPVFKDVVVSLTQDCNASVRLASLHAVLGYYDSDFEMVFTVMNQMIHKDIRVVCTHEWWEVMIRNYKSNECYYRELLVKGCESQIESVASKSAGLVCAIAIFEKDAVLLEYILNHPFTEKQQDNICRQAASSFGNDEHHDRSSEILTHMVKSARKELDGLGSLFFEKSVDIQKDEDFLVLLMSSQQSRHLRHVFLEYLVETDEDICKYINVLSALAESLAKEAADWESRLLTEDLIKCVIKLFDRGMRNTELRHICLDIWDNLFRSNLEDIRPISEKLSDQ